MKKLQQGFSIVTAIFLLVVLSFLGIAMVMFSTSQQQSSAMDVLGSRAYQAARAGIEWAAYGVTQTTPGTLWAGCATGQTFAANSLGGTLAPFTVTVTCTSASYIEDTSTTWVYNVTSTAKTAGAPGAPDYIERAINVKMGR